MASNIISDYQDLRTFSIRVFLESNQIYPVGRANSRYGLYHAPYREDRHPSMMVNFEKNTWCDFATGEGGRIIQLCMKLYSVDFREACKKLQQIGGIQSLPILRQTYIEERYCEKKLRLISVKKLQHIALLQYLDSRCIGLDLAQNYLKEVYYQNEFSGRLYFALGFENNSGGYELRSKYFKGATAKDIRIFSYNHDSCYVFEGFMDYLSFLMLYKDKAFCDAVVLNSLVNIERAKDFMFSHKNVYCMLDNDKSGKKIYKELESENSLKVADGSLFYKDYKDINDYLMAKKSKRNIR